MRSKLYSEQNWTPGWRYVASILLMVLSFPPWNIWPLCFICLIPWIDELFREHKQSRLILGGLLFGFLATLFTSYWMSYFFVEFFHIPWNLSLVLFELYAFVANSQFLIFSLLSNRILKTVFSDIDQYSTKKGPLQILSAILLALLFTGIDWITFKPFQDTLGHAFYNAEIIRQFADIGGAPILTALIVLVNITLWFTLKQFLLNRKIPKLQILFTTCVLSSVLIYGTYRIHYVQKLISEAPLKIQFAAIQGNIGNQEKSDIELGVEKSQTKTLETYLRLSKKALTLTPKPDVLAWPETAYPRLIRSPLKGDQKLMEPKFASFLSELNMPIFFGGYQADSQRLYNAILLAQPQSETQSYRKSILIWLVETLPNSKYLNWVRSIFPETGRLTRGSGPTVLNLNLPKKFHPLSVLNVGPVICYEDLFPNYVIESARNGSQIILDAGNDNWFGKHGEPYNHLGFAVFRSIETRLPMLRVANSGISAVVLPDGSITSRTPVGEEAVMNVNIPINQPIPTLMKAWGNWFGPTALILGLLGIFWIYFWELPRKSKSSH